MYSRENYASAKAEIEQRRINAISTAEGRNAELGIKSPEIREIDTELRKTGLALFRTACSGGDIEPIKAKNVELMKKREKIILSLGYPCRSGV